MPVPLHGQEHQDHEPSHPGIRRRESHDHREEVSLFTKQNITKQNNSMSLLALFKKKPFKQIKLNFVVSSVKKIN